MNKKKILIVDDEKEMADLESIRFEAHGYEVLTAYDGESGLAKARNILPDLVILDIMLPRLDGYTVCQTLKKDPQCRSIPIILVTAVDQKFDTEKVRQVGADFYFTKPYESPILLAKIKELLRQSKQA